MQESEFAQLAEAVISYVAEKLELEDKEYRLEVDMLGDILSIKTAAGQYILNKHTAAREVWLASPLSGPYHFAYHGGKWVNKKGIELLSLLSEELKIILIQS